MLYSGGKGISGFREIPGAQGAAPADSLSGGTDEMLKSGRGLLRTALLTALLATFLLRPAFAEEPTTLGPGSRGEAVVNLKTELNEKGYYTVKNDRSDAYTSSLKNAVGVFQVANSIPKPIEGYGYADQETQVKAASDDAVFYAEYIQDKQLQPGGRGDYVKKTQKQLTRLGYYAGKIDGKYRTSTVVAVKYFQKANSLVEDGIADKETRDVLYSSDAKSRAQYEEANYLTPLSYGSKGAQVAQLQARLVAKGFYWGEPTGLYDAQTKYCVKFFQEVNGFSVTGNATKALRAKINEDSAVSFQDYVKARNLEMVQLSSSARPGVKVAVLQLKLKELGYYKGVITGAYTGAVITAVRTFQTFNNMSSKYITGKANAETRKLMLDAKALTYGAVCGDNTLRSGAKGEAVKDLQNKLKDLGYYTGAVDGVYDGAVASAVRMFQQYNGFYPNGVAYTNVLEKLYSGSAVSYTNAKVEKLIDVAEAQLGDRYVSGKRGPDQFDCSGFTSYCLGKVGVYVTAEVQAQGHSSIGTQIKITDDTYYKELRRGDILFFWSPDHKKKPGHAAIYMGNNKFIHASSSVKKVTVSNFKTYNERSGGPWFLWAIRIWE
jgi:peptidoglycan hydrolase-like protein with peptidoglycan-binding domain